MLSNSTAFLYDDNALWAVKVIEVKSEVLDTVDKVDVKVDKVKAEVAEVKAEVVDIRTAVNNGMAIQLNSLRKWLDDPIQPISASVQIKDCQRYTVAVDFPTTVREFWRLLLNKSTLV